MEIPSQSGHDRFNEHEERLKLERVLETQKAYNASLEERLRAAEELNRKYLRIIENLSTGFIR